MIGTKDVLGALYEVFVWSNYFVPTSSKARKEFLDIVRQRVEHYQPLVENEFGIELGRVGVKDFDEAWGKLAYESVQRKRLEMIGNTRRLPTEIDMRLFWIGASIEADVCRIVSCMLPFVLPQISMGYHFPDIYVPFFYYHRMSDNSDFRRRKEHVDSDVVHELSHGLWYALGGESKSSKNAMKKEKQGHSDWRVWNEGFATYCSDVHFRSLYASTDITHKKGGVPEKGLELVVQLITEHGDSVLREIPKRWQEFDKY